MSVLMLTQEESDRFATWLEQDAISCDVIAKQMENLGVGFSEMVRRERAYAAAAMLIARKLRSTERMSITPTPPPPPRAARGGEVSALDDVCSPLVERAEAAARAAAFREALEFVTKLDDWDEKWIRRKDVAAWLAAQAEGGR